MDETTASQIEVCRRFQIQPFAAPADLKVGISRNVRDGVLPFHGVRHDPLGDTTGWYIWAGEMYDDPDFFVPLHVAHLPASCPIVVPYLLLPPGWRILLAPGYEDVWFDEQILIDEE